MKPRLRLHAEIHRQQFRGATWYILQDHQSGQYHRVSPSAHQIICRMDGRRTVGAIWALVGEQLGENQPTQDEVVRLLAQLHRADLLAGEMPPDMDELTERADRHSRRSLLMRLRNPLAMRFPLFDPDRWLDRTVPLVGLLFTTGGFMIWLALVGTGLVQAALNAPALLDNLADRAATTQNLLLLVLLYPAVKLFHELGHAYATKRWGGEVHELGIMLLILVPVPYVDASASLAFRGKWRRALVGAAGILVEIALASVAMLVWISVEPGLVRAIAFNVMLIGSVSTLLFNGNPLLRLDGYYVLADLLEIPNLAVRANRYMLYLIQRRVFGIAQAETPVTARGERTWFLVYGLTSFAYRLFVLLTISVVVAGKLFVFGIILALMSLCGALLMPVLKGLKFLLDSPQLDRRRGRAIGLTALFAGALAIALLAVPLPAATMAQGVVWVGDQATVRASADGFVSEVAEPDGTWVEAGTLLIGAEDPILSQSAVVIDRQREGLQRRLDAAAVTDQVQANLLREEIKHIEGEAELSRAHLRDLQIVAARSGRFLVADEQDLPGRFLHKGDTIGYVVNPGETIVRVVVPQSEVDRVRRGTLRIAIRPVDRVGEVRVAKLLREVPSASSELPHMALSTLGGGQVVIDPTHTDRPKALETLFQFDLALNQPLEGERLGERVYVRFDHPREALGVQLLRAARQLLLKQFSV